MVESGLPMTANSATVAYTVAAGTHGATMSGGSKAGHKGRQLMHVHTLSNGHLRLGRV
jgi:hypothetical protein